MTYSISQSSRASVRTAQYSMRSHSLAGRSIRHYSQYPNNKPSFLFKLYIGAVCTAGVVGGIYTAIEDMNFESEYHPNNTTLLVAGAGLGFLCGGAMYAAATAAFPITITVGGLYLLQKSSKD